MISLDPEIVKSNGTTKICITARDGARVVHCDVFALESARSRGKFLRDIEAKVNDPGATDGLEGRLLNLLATTTTAGVPEEHSAPKGKKKPALTPEQRESRSERYVLTPGYHVTAMGSGLEVGTDDFAASVIGSIPQGELYRRGGIPVEVAGEAGRRVCRQVGVDDLRLLIDRTLKLGKWSTHGKGDSAEQVLTFVACSRDNAGLVLARAAVDSRIPEINTFTTYPLFLPDFSVCAPGYHDGVYYDQPPELVDLEPISDPDVIRDTLDDLLIDFPFKAEPDRQNAIGMLISPLVREAVTGNTPAHLINSPLERTGKTKLIEELLGGVIAGQRTAAMQMPKNDEEVDKRVIAALMAGTTLIHLDNLPPNLDSPALASLLTTSTYTARLLGSTKMLSAVNNLNIFGTGNNVKFSGELAKRFVPIRLQPKTDDPERRTDFAHPDLWRYVLDNRVNVLGCLFGMVCNWRAAGAAPGTEPMGGFDSWAAIIGGVMRHAGYTEWLKNARSWRDEANSNKSDMQALVKEWHAIHGTGMATATELLEIAQRLELFPDVLFGRSDRADKSLQTSFGSRILSRNVDMPVGDWVIRRSTITRPATYYLRPTRPQAEEGVL